MVVLVVWEVVEIRHDYSGVGRGEVAEVTAKDLLDYLYCIEAGPDSPRSWQDTLTSSHMGL